ncbi:MAG: phage holin family protein [Alphaproteobacteria bacterium]|nr:phage holin family protein [Alphaproteobacteria bacterium]
MNLDRGIGTVFSELLGEISALIRNEIRLAKAEAVEKVRRMAIGLAMMVAGLFVLILSLVFLLEAAVGGLMLLGLNFAVSCLIVGAVIFAMGGLAIWLGLGRLKVGKLSETKTADQIRRDVASVRAQVQA